MTAPTTFAPDDTGDLVGAGVRWAGEASASDVFVDRAFVRWLIAELEARGDWAGVVDVARNTERAMAQSGRWGTWRSILESARHAAIAADDPVALGWALHQLGSRDLLRDDLGPARAALTRALAKREAIGDAGGVAATRHNLRILPLALAGVMTLLTAFVGLVALLIPSFDHPDVPEPDWVLDIDEEVVTLAELQDPDFRINLHNRGTVALDGLTISSEDEGVPVEGELGSCGLAIPIDGSCELRLDVTQVTEADLPLVVNVVFPHAVVSAPGGESTAPQRGDRRVLIHAGLEAG